MAHFLRGYDYGFVLECLKRSLKCTKIVKHLSDLRMLFTANDNTPVINLLVVPHACLQLAFPHVETLKYIYRKVPAFVIIYELYR